MLGLGQKRKRPNILDYIPSYNKSSDKKNHLSCGFIEWNDGKS